MTEDEIKEEAKQYARKNKKKFISIVVDEKIHLSTLEPVTFFMAGSPGAGKTEISKILTDSFKNPPVRIDADEIRSIFPKYTGSNAHVFQYPASIVVDDMYHYCLKHELNIILDGTFAYKGSLDNIKASLRKNRIVEIFFIYQEPVLAWRFTQAREVKEKRMIRKDDFIDTFLRAIDNVEIAKKEFGSKIKINLIIKDYNNNSGSFHMNVNSLGNYIPKLNRRDLEKMIV